jgi:hypothetical protein
MSIEIHNINDDVLNSWPDYELILREWLATGGEYLALNADKSSSRILNSICQEPLPKVDLIQLCTLGNFEKGELGIRELHWKLSSVLVSSKFLRRSVLSLPSGRLMALSKLQIRLQQMVTRKYALDQILRDFSHIGIPIPHYVEPRTSTIVISQNFAKSLLEFNLKGYLTFDRAYFALARSSNFKCIRITGI